MRNPNATLADFGSSASLNIDHQLTLTAGTLEAYDNGSINNNGRVDLFGGHMFLASGGTYWDFGPTAERGN
jgi:hypothetical protein